MHGRFSKENITFAESPTKFEAGTMQTAEVVAFSESIKLIEKIGFPLNPPFWFFKSNSLFRLSRLTLVLVAIIPSILLVFTISIISSICLLLISGDIFTSIGFFSFCYWLDKFIFLIINSNGFFS